MEWHAEMPGDLPQVVVVGDHGHQIAAQLAELVRQQEIVEAMRRLAGEHRHARATVRVRQIERQLERLRERGHPRGYPFAIEAKRFQVPAQAHEEQPGLGLGVLIGIEDVSAVAENEIGEGRHQSRSVAAADEQGGPQGIAHRRLASRAVRTCTASASSNGSVSCQGRHPSVMLWP